MERDLMIVISEAGYRPPMPNRDQLKDYGIGLVWVLDELKVRDVKLGLDATQYCNGLHKQIHEVEARLKNGSK